MQLGQCYQLGLLGSRQQNSEQHKSYNAYKRRGWQALRSLYFKVICCSLRLVLSWCLSFVLVLCACSCAVFRCLLRHVCAGHSNASVNIQCKSSPNYLELRLMRMATSQENISMGLQRFKQLHDSWHFTAPTLPALTFVDWFTSAPPSISSSTLCGQPSSATVISGEWPVHT